MAVTRLGEGGYGVRRYGSFAGKTPDLSGGTHPVGIITRLALDGYGVRRYSSFVGKTQSENPIVVVPTAPDNNAAGGIASSTKRRPGVYVDGLRRVRNEINERLEEQAETVAKAVIAETIEAEPAVPLILENLPPLESLSADQRAEEMRRREIEQKLKMMLDEDEAIALLLLN